VATSFQRLHQWLNSTTGACSTVQLHACVCKRRPQTVKPISQLRFDYDTTTTRLRREIDNFIFCSRRMEAGARDTSYSRIVVSQSNRTHIVILITSVVVECVVVSSYRSCVVVESQLWYRLTIRLRSDYDVSHAPASILRDSTRVKK